MGAAGCGAAGAELNNEWRLSECPTTVEKKSAPQKIRRGFTHTTAVVLIGCSGEEMRG